MSDITRIEKYLSAIESGDKEVPVPITRIEHYLYEIAQNGGGGASSADDVSYDNTSSGLEATNVQDAIDEIAQGGGGFVVSDTAPSDTGVLWIDPTDDTTFPAGTNVGDLLVWNGTEWVARHAPRLPNTYQEVEWIQSSDTQYIDTGVALKQSTRFVLEQSSEYTEAVFKVAGTQKYINNKQHVLSYGNVAANPGVLSLMFLSKDVPTDADWIATSSANNGTKRTIDMQNGSQKVNGVELGTQQLDNVTSNKIHLFARYTSSDTISPYVTEKIYSCKIYDNETLIRYFVPCYLKADDSVIGLYDMINDQFYGNDGTGTFTKGADV